MSYRLSARLLIPLAFLVATGCATQKTLEDVTYDPLKGNPTRKPVYNVSTLEAAFSCMDSKLSEALSQPYGFGIDEIKDKAGVKVQSGREFLINSMQRVNARNRVYISDWSPEVNESGVTGSILAVDSKRLGFGKALPQYVIRGSITQSHKAEQAGEGFGINLSAIGGSKKQVVGATSIALDLRLVELKTQIVLTTSSNVLALSNSATNSSMYVGKIGKAEFDYDVNWEQSEGIAAGVRTLTDMGTIELLGKVFRIDYLDCLDPKRAEPQSITKASPDAQNNTVHKASELSTLNAPGDHMSITVGKFHTKSPTVKINSFYDYTVNVTQDGYLYCFYRAAADKGNWIMVYPTSYTTNAEVMKGTSLTMPTKPMGFRLSADKVGTEKIICAITESDITRKLPKALTPFPGEAFVIHDFINENSPILSSGEIDIRVER